MSAEKEYMVQIWGGAWNKDAKPSIEHDLGIKKGTYYFPTLDKRDKFLELLNNPVYKKQGIMIVKKYGYMRHKRTIFVGTFKYHDKEFVVHYDLDYEYPEDSAVSYFTLGNFSCDCNRSLAIRWEYGEDAIPELDCGHEIELLDHHIEYWD